MTTPTYDVLSVIEFEEEVQRIARFTVHPPVQNPLTDAVQKIRDNPWFAQSRLLSRIVSALTHESGEFRRAEASGLDSATLGLVVGLMTMAHAGTTSRDCWLKAASDCDAAVAG